MTLLSVAMRDRTLVDLRTGFDGAAFALRRLRAGVFLGGVSVRGDSPASGSALSSSSDTGACRLAGVVGGGILEPACCGSIKTRIFWYGGALTACSRRLSHALGVQHL